MGTYVHFTDEQKYRANNVDLADFLRCHGETLIASGREKRLKSDHSITVRGNEWYDHETEQGGYSIDFVRRHFNLSFPDAVTMLLGGEQGVSYPVAEKKPAEPKKPFALPNAHTDMRRTFAYLVKSRHIDGGVVSHFAKAKLIYESCEKSKDGAKEYHNAVFVGLDENGVARHAHKRGIYTEGKGFKGNVDSCNPAYSFHHIGTSNRLYVFEAPIDMLSFLSMYPKGWHQHSFVSLCGVGGQAMFRILELNTQITRPILCLDNDEAGQKATTRLTAALSEKGYTAGKLVSQAKDWNEDLTNAANPQIQPVEMKMA